MRLKHDCTRFKRDRTVPERNGKDIGAKPLTQGVNGIVQIVGIRCIGFTHPHQTILDNGLE